MNVNDMQIGECFELAFFAAKTDADRTARYICELLKIERGRGFYEEHEITLLEKRLILFETFEFDGLCEYVVNFTDLYFTEAEFYKNILCGFTMIVYRIMSQIPEIKCATGIYELTGYLTSEVKSVADFDAALLSKFPVAFFRDSDTTLDVYCRYDGISCAVSTDAQTIFTDYNVCRSDAPGTVRIKNIEFISLEAREAVVTLSDGTHDMLCFSQPFDTDIPPRQVYALDAEDVRSADGMTPVISRTGSGFGHFIIGDVTDTANGVVRVGAFSIVAGRMPNFVMRGDRVGFRTARIDLY